jgi:type I restriction enzyme M protein
LPGRVKFVDAKNFVIAKGPREKVLNDYSLNSFIHSDKEDDNVVKIVYNEQIRDNDYNLSVARYFQKQIEGVKLGDILELVRGRRGNLPETGKLIRIRDLKDDKVDFTLDVSSVEETEVRRPDIHLVSESCLLLAMRWRTLKPTLFEFKGEPIFRSQDILCFKINEAIADKAYLINELHADYVREQLESYRLGASVMPFIRKDDLMEVVIKFPSIEEQRAKVQGIYELSDKIKSLQEERNALAHGKTLKQFSEFASLKHTLGRPRQNILDWSDNLLDFLTKKKEDFEALNKAFSEFYDIDIISALKEIKRDVNFITDVLEKGENGLVLSEYEKQVIPLSDINSIINELSNNGFNFKIKKLLLKGEKLKERGIYANKTLFKTLLDNILTNANKYAFDKKATGNEVVIELTEVDDSLSMEIRNNGKPFPKNFDREKFITKYSTADSSNGSGLGGYDIHRIASNFNNPDWILSLYEDPFFLVKFKFQFPIKLIN